MTNKQMTEVFSILMLAYPKAEMFQGGIEKLTPTIKLWTNCFKDVPYENIQKAVYDLIKTNPYPPTIAELTKCLKQNVINAGISTPALWQRFNRYVDVICKYMDNFNFTWVQEDGKTQGEHYRIKAKNTFDEMPELFKMYVGDYAGMLNTCRDYDAMSSKSKIFEQHRFEEFVKEYVESKNYSELMLIANDEKLLLNKGKVYAIDKRRTGD